MNQDMLNYNDKRDFDYCNRGYINMEYPSKITKIVINENNVKNVVTIWDCDNYRFIPNVYDPAKTPNTVDKSLWRQACLNNIRGWFKVCDGVYQFRGYDMANLTLIETDAGVVVIDCTTVKETAEKALELYRNYTKKPFKVAAVMITHTHTDHYGGIEGVTGGDSTIPVYAPENFTTEAALENVIVGDAMSRRSTYMYGTFLNPKVDSHVDSGLGKALEKGGSVGFAKPTQTVVPVNYRNLGGTVYEEQEIVIGGIRFEFMLCPHTEAPAEMTVYIHGKEVMVGAEILNHTLHNALTPRGAEVRDIRLWWKAIDKLLAKHPGVMVICNTHHWPIWVNDEAGKPYPGENRCREFLEQQRDTYKYLHDQTVRLINKGYTMLEIAAEFDKANFLPDLLKAQWHNRGYYGTISHDVRAIYQKYLGWYDMNPANLNPLPPEQTARRYMDEIGEDQAYRLIKSTLQKDIKQYEEDYRFAAEIGKHLVFSNPSTLNRELLSRLYQQMGFTCEAGTWRDMYLTGAAELLKNGPLANMAGTANPAILNTIDNELYFDYVASRVIGPMAIQYPQDFAITMMGEATVYASVKNGVLNYHGKAIAGAIPFTTSRAVFTQLVMGTRTAESAWGNGLTGKETDKKTILGFFALFEHAAANFNIVLPKVNKEQKNQIPQEDRKKILACAMMFERYEYRMVQLLGDYNKALVSLDTNDMNVWRSKYYYELTFWVRALPEGNRPYLEDNLFFKDAGQRIEECHWYGVGSDGIFCKHEYAHFMYECYKALARDAGIRSGIVRDCIMMLEPYVEKFRGGSKYSSQAYVLNKTGGSGCDFSLWIDRYHPTLVKSNIIVDDKFFDPTGKNEHWGIGTDGIFNLAELCNVLARCYKLLLTDTISDLLTK